MFENKKILCIIPARGGSKRLPGKNIKPFLGKPLIAYAIDAAKASKYVDRVLVSTDDNAIAAVANQFGADVPFNRPVELASDTATTLSVLQHAIEFVEQRAVSFEIIVLIQPTVPGVQTKDIDGVIEKLIQSGTNSCITVSEVSEPPQWMYRLEEDGRITPYIDAPLARSQDLQMLYRINGAVYATLRETLIKGGKIIDNESCAAVVMPRERSVDIDTQTDFTIAEALLK